MDIFIKRNDQVVIDVYAWEENGNVDAASDDKDIPKNIDSNNVDIVKFVFRRPNNADSTRILAASGFSAEGVPTNIMGFQDEALRTLLLEIRSGDDVRQVKARDINNLHPALAGAAVRLSPVHGHACDWRRRHRGRRGHASGGRQVREGRRRLAHRGPQYRMGLRHVEAGAESQDTSPTFLGVDACGIAGSAHQRQLAHGVLAMTGPAPLTPISDCGSRSAE